MLNRRGEGQSLRLIFTSDFHELVRGAAVPGQAVLRYDPFRIVPLDDYATAGPVTMNVRFHPGGETWEQTVPCAPDALQPQLADPAGQGYMLVARLDVPADGEELECWFTYQSAAGKTLVDDADGQNYWLRIPQRDLTIQTASVSDGDAGSSTDVFRLVVTSTVTLDDLTVRWRYARPAEEPRQEVRLEAANDGKTWATPTAGLPVPHGAVVIFDLVYHVNGHEFTDDNEGTWYIVAAANL